MRRYVHTILASLLCVCLLVSYAPLPASAAGSHAEPSVSGLADVVMNGETAQGSTAVNVLTVGLSIAGKTHDVTASIGDIMKDDAVADGKRTYVLKVVIEGADPAACEYAWSRAVVKDDGVEIPDGSFSDERSSHPLVDDAKAGLLVTDTLYRYQATVTDPSSGQTASADIRVTVSDDYLDRTLAHVGSGVSVSGALLRSLADDDLSVESIDSSSPTYGFIQQAAEGMDVQSAWQVGLSGATNSKAPFSGSLEVSLPAGFEDGTAVSVVMLGSDGATSVVEAQAKDGKAVVEVATLGAFAIAVPASRTFTVTAMAGEGGAVSPAGAKSYAEGAEPAYTFLPAAGHVLDSVTVDGDPVEVRGNSYRFAPLSADHELRASFKKVEPDDAEHAVTARVIGGHGLVSLDGVELSAEQTAQAKHGASVLVRFAPDEGYTVNQVTVRTAERDPVLVETTGEEYLVAAVEGDTVVEVTYRAGSAPPVPVHSVTASVASGKGTVSPERVEVAHGGSATFTFVPDDGWRIASVALDGRDVSSQLENGALVMENVVEGHRVIVSFEKRQIELEEPLVSVEVRVEAHAEGGMGGQVSPSGTLKMVRGSSQTFYVYPDKGYDLDRVLVNGKTVSARPIAPPVLRMARVAGSFGCYSFVVQAVSEDTQVSVFFRKLAVEEEPLAPVATHQVRASATGGGMISPEGVSEVPYGGSLSFALQSDEGHRLASLTENGKDVTYRVSGGSFKLDAVTEDMELVAAFEPAPEDPERPAFTFVRASAGEGGIVTPSGNVPVRTGGSQTFGFVPDDGYVLDKVTVDGSEVVPTDGVYTLGNVVESCEVRATFRLRTAADSDPVLPDLRTVTATAGKGGTVTPSGEVKVVAGSSIAFALDADEGFKLQSVMLDGEDASELLEEKILPLEKVTEDHAIAATFDKRGQNEENPPEPPATVHTVTARVEGGHGSVSPDGAVSVAEGADQTFYFRPDEGYAVGEVQVDGARVPESPSSWTLEGVCADHEVVVTFEPASTLAPGSKPTNPLAEAGRAVSSMTKTGDAPKSLVVTFALVAATAIMLLARSRRGEDTLRTAQTGLPKKRSTTRRG